MVVTRLQALTMQSELRNVHPGFTLKNRLTDEENEIVILTEHLTLTSEGLSLIAKIAEGHVIDFSRSGEKVRIRIF